MWGGDGVNLKIWGFGNGGVGECVKPGCHAEVLEA